MAVDFRYGSAGIMKKLEAVAIHDRDVIAVVDQNVVAGEIVDNDMQIVELQQEKDQAFQNKLEIMPFPACQDIVAQRGTLAFRHDITDERAVVYGGKIGSKQTLGVAIGRVRMWGARL